MKKVLIAGSSVYHNKKFVYEYLDALKAAGQVTYLVTNNLTGAQQDATSWAKENKIEHAIYFKHIDIFEEEKDIYCCVVFPYLLGTNTNDILRLAESNNIPIIYAPIQEDGGNYDYGLGML